MTALPQAPRRRALTQRVVSRSEESRSDEWRTPPWLFGWASHRYGGYGVDVAASKHNTQCEHFITKSENAIEQRWDDYATDFDESDETNWSAWCNSPFSTGNKLAFTERGRWHVREGHLRLSTHLLPHDTKDGYWRDAVMRPEGRLLGAELEMNPFGPIWRWHFKSLVVEKVEVARSVAFAESRGGTRSTARFSVVLVTFARPGVLPALVQAPAHLSP